MTCSTKIVTVTLVFEIPSDIASSLISKVKEEIPWATFDGGDNLRDAVHGLVGRDIDNLQGNDDELGVLYVHLDWLVTSRSENSLLPRKRARKGKKQ